MTSIESNTAGSVPILSNHANGSKAKKSHHKRRKKPSAANNNLNHPEVATKIEQKEDDRVENNVIGDIEIEYVVEKPADIDPSLGEVFDRLGKIKPDDSGNESALLQASLTTAESAADAILDSLADEFGKEASKKELKKKTRPTVAQLKQIAPRPAVVEIHDATSPDPELLVFLKSCRAAVPVPRHWATSTRFLASKRVSDKKPYQLPDYIANTGIGKLREASDDANDSLQKRQRERARPKLGRIEIDYNVLYDAFFKYQTKPRLTRHGELYYEGKEQEKDFSKFIPGVLSDELRQALGMPLKENGNQNADVVPPPWLFTMQRIGPPPSYPMIKYPGVNAPLPPGAQYGPGPGQWGKPPLDAYGKGLYGDVLGTSTESAMNIVKEAPVKLWGDVLSESVEVEEDEEEFRRKRARMEQEEEDEALITEEEEQASVNPAVQQPQQQPVAREEPVVYRPPASLVPEEVVDLRKKPTQAYKVLEKQALQVAALEGGGKGEVFGSNYKYAIGSSSESNREVAVAIAPEMLESGGVDQKELEKMYEEERARTKKAMGVAPGAGHINVAEIEQQVLKKKAADKDSKKSKASKTFKF